MEQFWKPRYKWELVEWMCKNFPDTKEWKWKKMSKKQLYGKYISLRLACIGR